MGKSYHHNVEQKKLDRKESRLNDSIYIELENNNKKTQMVQTIMLDIWRREQR